MRGDGRDLVGRVARALLIERVRAVIRQIEVVEFVPVAGGVEMPALLQGRIGDRRNTGRERAAGGGLQAVHCVVGIKFVEIRAGFYVLPVGPIAGLIVAVFQLGQITGGALGPRQIDRSRPNRSRPG